jgi:uncharacterized protein YjbI with pentapeptide repeats
MSLDPIAGRAGSGNHDAGTWGCDGAGIGVRWSAALTVSAALRHVAPRGCSFAAGGCLGGGGVGGDDLAVTDRVLDKVGPDQGDEPEDRLLSDGPVVGDAVAGTGCDLGSVVVALPRLAGHVQPVHPAVDVERHAVTSPDLGLVALVEGLDVGGRVDRFVLDAQGCVGGPGPGPGSAWKAGDGDDLAIVGRGDGRNASARKCEAPRMNRVGQETAEHRAVSGRPSGLKPATSRRRAWLTPGSVAVGLAAVVVGGVAAYVRPYLRAPTQGWGWFAAGVLLGGLAVTGAGVWWRVGSARASRTRLVVSEVATDVGVALTTGAVVGLVLFAATETLERGLLDAQERIDERRVEREVQRDNVRFVREVATQPDPHDKPFARLDLREGQLALLDLTDANFSQANLTDADLQGADLSRANLLLANLDRADLAGAHLIEADLSGVELRGADLSSADLSGANLHGAELAYTVMYYADLSGTNLLDANLVDAHMPNVDLSGAELDGSTVLTGANLYGADFSGTDASEADLSNTNLNCVTYDGTTVWPDGFTPPQAGTC